MDLSSLLRIKSVRRFVDDSYTVKDGCSVVWKAQCLVEGVETNEELAHEVKDDTTQCGVVTVFVVPWDVLQRQVKDRVCEWKEVVRDNVKRTGLEEFLEQVLDLDMGNGDGLDVRKSSQAASRGGLPIGEGEAKHESGVSVIGEKMMSVIRKIYKDVEVLKLSDPLEESDLADLLNRGPIQPCHPNWLPLYLVLETNEEARLFVFGSTPHTLEAMIKFNYQALRPAALSTRTPPRLGDINISETDPCSDEQMRFLLYQILRAVQFLHDSGEYHGDIKPTNIHVSTDLWIHIDPPLLRSLPNHQDVQEERTTQQVREKLTLLTSRWRHGKLSNLDYLMVINAAAGRHMADATFHPVIPWVTDFTSSALEPSDAVHWRDLTKSKYRLAKGDHQLDITFKNSPTPHHITESLSEITYYIYMARSTPLATLRSVVRSNFEAKEYPASMARMYEWTPDECIPEFFLDPTVFASTHTSIDMPDLQLPRWCATPEEFIRWHRAALESDHVSQHLHHWIDLNFGYKLSGDAAIQAKNVTLPLSSLPSHRLRKSPGFVQVFTAPHPPKIVGKNDAFPSIELFEDICSFEKKFAHLLQPIYRNPRRPETTNEDMFAIGCIMAEMYLGKPILTEATQIEVNRLEGLNQLPERARKLVKRLLGSNPPSPKQCCSEFPNLFPHWFSSVFQFLADFQQITTWHDRLAFLKSNLEQVLLSVDDRDPTERLRLIQLIQPALLKCMRQGCSNTKGETPIWILRTVGNFVDVSKELLPTATSVYEQLQTKEKWDLLEKALEPEAVLDVFRIVGAKAFMRHYYMLLNEALVSGSASREIRNLAVFSLIALSKSAALGEGLSVRMILKPLLTKWSQLKVFCVGPLSETMDCVHFKHFHQDERKWNHEKVLTLANRLSENLAPGKSSTTPLELVLPLQAPIVKVIRYVSVHAGRAVVYNLLLPTTMNVFQLIWDSKEDRSEPKCQVALMDIISVLICILPVLKVEEIKTQFLVSNNAKVRPMFDLLVDEILSMQEQSDRDFTVMHLYVAIFLTFVMHRVGFASLQQEQVKSLQRLFIVGMSNNYHKEEFTPAIVWILRILYLSLQNSFHNKGEDDESSLLLRTIVPSEDTVNTKFLKHPYQLKRLDISSQAGSATLAVLEMMTSEEVERLHRIGRFRRTNSSAGQVDPVYNNLALDEDEEEEEDNNNNLVIDDTGNQEQQQNQQPSITSSKLKNRASSLDFMESAHDTEQRSVETRQSKNKMEDTNMAIYNAWIAGGATKQQRKEDAKGQILHSVQAHDHPIITMEADSNERLLVTSCRGEWVKFWDITGGPVEVDSFKSSRPISAIRLMNQGTRCLLLDGGLRIYDATSGQTASVGGKTGANLSTVPVGVAHRPILSVEKSPCQSMGADFVFHAATIAGTIDCIDLRTPNAFVSSHKLPYTQQSRGGGNGLTTSCLAVGGTYAGGWVAAGRPSGHVSVIDPRMGSILGHWRAHESPVVSLHHLELPKPPPAFLNVDDPGMENPIEFHPVEDEEYEIPEFAQYQLLSISQEGSARVWDISRYHGFENCHDRPLIESNRPHCRIRIYGLPVATRFSRVLAPPNPKKQSASLVDDNASTFSKRFRSASAEEPDGFFETGTNDTGDSNVTPGFRRTSSLTSSASEMAVHERRDRVETIPVVSSGSSNNASSALLIKGSNGTPPPPTPPLEVAIPPVSSAISLNNSVTGPNSPSNASTVSHGTIPDFQIPSRLSPSGSLGSAPPQHRSGRVYVSIPQCDTVALWNGTFTGPYNDQNMSSTLFMGSENSLAQAKLKLSHNRATEMGAKLIKLSHPEDTRMRISSLRSLPMHGLVIAGTEKGQIHAFI